MTMLMITRNGTMNPPQNARMSVAIPNDAPRSVPCSLRLKSAQGMG